MRDFVSWYLRKKRKVAVSLDQPGQACTLAGALERLAARNLRLGSVIDVGASNGWWSAQLMPYQPSAHYLCIEAYQEHEPGLQTFVAAHPQAQYVICAAGDHEGTAHFHRVDLLGGWVSHSPGTSDTTEVRMTTIDKLVTEHQLPAPFLIKLDTHGFELPILAGAAKTLENTEALVVEVYNFPGARPALPFYEFCQVMAGKGFRCIDLFDPLYRQHDGALWQMDLMFLRDTRPEFQRLSYT